MKREELALEWVRKAESDYLAASALFKVKPSPPFGIICFHCQQCAEKYLKAYLTANSREFEKTHDIEDLVLICSKIDGEFERLLEKGLHLTPYAVATRYPGFMDREMNEPKAVEALKICEEIRNFVSEKLKK